LLESQKYDTTINRYFTSTIGSKMSNLQQVIEAAFEKRAEITPKTVDAQTRAAIEEVIEGLDSGKYRVAEKIDDYLSVSMITKSLMALKLNTMTKWH